jgi:isochorismate synthase
MDGFLLAMPDYVLSAAGGRGFGEPASAVAALRAGTARHVVGALPFRPDHRPALFAPETIRFVPGPLDTAARPPLPAASIVGQDPSPQVHKARVAALVERLRRTELRKVVAARAVEIRTDDAVDPATLLAHLVARHPQACGYAVSLDAAGQHGATLVGCSPELLVRVRGSRVTLRPLAGSAPRSADRTVDEQQAEKLLASVKNREEHSYVIDWIRERLRGVCVELDVPSEPQLVATPDVWHLATPITARLAEPRLGALELAVLLHPTPAVGGTPTDQAMAVIAECEADRGFYGGAVGWCDGDGDGDWIVAIRCAQVSADRRTARVYAGGGIVLGSDPQLELDETTAKLRTLLAPLGVRPR